MELYSSWVEGIMQFMIRRRKGLVSYIVELNRKM